MKVKMKQKKKLIWIVHKVNLNNYIGLAWTISFEHGEKDVSQFSVEMLWEM